MSIVKRVAIAAMASMAVGVIAFMLVSCMFPWTPLDCRHEDVDIHSGRIRTTQYLLFIPVQERVEETWISQTIGPSLGPPQWRRVNTFSPGVHHSPHYVYHGAIAQLRSVENVQTMIPFSPPARQHVAREMLMRWQTGSDEAAKEYVDRVLQVAMSHIDNRVSHVDVNDLP
jgi:hypothetical protein